MLITTMTIHEVLAKKTFEFNSKINKIPSQIHLIMGQNVMNES
jgi:hypothetical protein